ncbi:ectonucleoside triphosphate diphosphohydrolase 3-like [Brevipalpus obovatus]|uniref:ectonucleoside triphosphate diphosphohydrolase 3-like n=1 Tax=Brevipalpus obovatus TaxID=246614 RepID=UPI003D9EDBBF
MVSRQFIVPITGISLGLGILITSAVLLGVCNYFNYEYAIVIDSGYQNSTFNLFRWKSERTNFTTRPESLDTCQGPPIVYQSPSDSKALEEALIPCVSKLTSMHSAIKFKENGATEASSLYFAGSGELRILSLASPDKATKLVESVANILQNKSHFNVRSVSLVNDAREATYAWIAGNIRELNEEYLDKPMLDQIKDDQTKSNSSTELIEKISESIKTHGILDLSETVSHAAWEVNQTSVTDAVKITLFGRNHTIKSFSNVCFGSDKAKLRLSLLLLVAKDSVNKNATIDDPCLPINTTRSVFSDNLASDECLSGTINKPPSGLVYKFTGKGDSEKCLEIISKEILDQEACKKNFKHCLMESSTAPLLPSNVSFVALNDYLRPIDVLNFTASSHHINDSDYLNQTHFTCKLTVDQIKPKMSGFEASEICFRLTYNYVLLKNVHKIANWSNIIWDRSLLNWSRWPLGIMSNATAEISPINKGSCEFSLTQFVVCSSLGLLSLAFSLYSLYLTLKLRRLQNKEVYEPIQQNPM